jgi:hypothetical protein
MKKDRLDYCAATWDPRHTGTLVWSGTVDVGLVQYHP